LAKKNEENYQEFLLLFPIVVQSKIVIFKGKKKGYYGKLKKIDKIIF